MGESSEISWPLATRQIPPQIFQSGFQVWLGILAGTVREQKEFIDRTESIIKGKRIEFYKRESSFSALQDESHESESFFKGVLARKGSGNSKSCKIYKKEKHSNFFFYRKYHNFHTELKTVYLLINKARFPNADLLKQMDMKCFSLKKIS